MSKNSRQQKTQGTNKRTQDAKNIQYIKKMKNTR